MKRGVRKGAPFFYVAAVYDRRTLAGEAGPRAQREILLSSRKIPSLLEEGYRAAREGVASRRNNATVIDRRYIGIFRRRPLPATSIRMKARLSRLEQIYRDFPIYYITCCTQARRPLLANDSIQQALHTFITHGEERHIFVGRYVIMPDHLHLFVAIPEEFDLSGWMKSLKNFLSKVLRSSNVQAPHWQKGFFDHVLRSDRSYEAKWLYVRQNPVEEGLVKNPEDWPYQGELHPLSYG